MPIQTLAPPVTERIFTFAEFETFAEIAEINYELENGYLIEMPRSSIIHARVSTNIARLLFLIANKHEPEEFGVFADSAGIGLFDSSTCLFPDFIVCTNTAIFDEERSIALLLNPALIIEMLSPSTWRRDKGVKQYAYLALPTLENYMMVSQTERKVEVWNRDDHNEWLLHTYTNPPDEISLLGGKIRLKPSDIYKNIF